MQAIVTVTFIEIGQPQRAMTFASLDIEDGKIAPRHLIDGKLRDIYTGDELTFQDVVEGMMNPNSLPVK